MLRWADVLAPSENHGNEAFRPDFIENRLLH